MNSKKHAVKNVLTIRTVFIIDSLGYTRTLFLIPKKSKESFKPPPQT